MHEAEPYGHLLVNGKQPTHAQLAIMAGASERECSKLMQELYDAGVPSCDEVGNWYSRRMVRDAHRRAINRENGKGGGNPKLKDKADVPRRISESDNRPHNRTDNGSDKSHDARDPEARSQKLDREKPNPNGLGKKPTKGSRLANDWQPDSEDRGFCASELGWSEERIDREAARFRDYWTEQPGQRGVKIRWHGTWRNWCRRAHESRDFITPGGPAKDPRRPPAGERRSAIYASVADELEPVGTAAGGGGGSGFGASGGDVKPLAIVASGPRGLDGADVSNATNAAEGIVENVAGDVGEVSGGRSETGDGSGDRNPQMGDPAEGGAGDRNGGSGLVLSASANGEGETHVGDYPAGVGRGGQDEDLLEIPPFLRRA